jgi:hypothetical protein
MRATGGSRRWCLLLLASLGACGGKPEATSLSMATSVGEASSDATTASGTSDSTTDTSTADTDTSTTDTSTSDTDDPSTSAEGCVDAGNLPPDDYIEVTSNSGPPVIGSKPLPIPADFGSGVSECDEYAQDCPAEEKCVPYASTGGTWNANKCVPVLGDGMIGEPCTYAGAIEATDDCGQDSACWLVDDQGMGTCTGFCGGTAQTPECPPTQYCLQLHGAVAFCIDGCNPLEQACPADQACFWTGDGFSCTLTAAKFPGGEPCGDFDDCGISLICVDAALLPSCGGASCCAEFCDLDCADLCSQVGTSCVPFFELGEAPPGEGDIGICVAP